MYKQFVGGSAGIERNAPEAAQLARSGDLSALVALEHVGVRRSFARDDEIYAEGDPSDSWFRVVSGAVRVCKLMADGRRHIAEFYFSGDCFGLENAGNRVFSAEAVGDVIVMRFLRRSTERLIAEQPYLARQCAIKPCAISPMRRHECCYWHG